MIFVSISAEKIGAFELKNRAKLSKNLIITLFFEKNQFFAENCRKSQKIVIITIEP
jgi:hypothetical protein